MHEVRNKFGAFAEDTKKCDCKPHQYYIVKVDIERCFDTIKPDKMFEIARQVFTQDRYILRRHWVVQDEPISKKVIPKVESHQVNDSQDNWYTFSWWKVLSHRVSFPDSMTSWTSMFGIDPRVDIRFL